MAIVEMTQKKLHSLHTHLTCPFCEHNGCFTINDNYSYKCYSCNKWGSDLKKEYEGAIEDIVANSKSNAKNYRTKSPVNYSEESAGVYADLSDRNISKDTAQFYGVRVSIDSSGKPTQHFYPYFNESECTAIKTRFVASKDFRWTTGTSGGTGLFGEQLFRSGGKYVTLVEGECDAMAAYQMMGSKWPVVSIKNGAASADRDVKDSLEFLESFDNIVIAFDSDKAGQEAALKVARLFKPNTAKILRLPTGIKDPNELLRQGRGKDFSSAWWDAKTYTPSGIINVVDYLDKYRSREKQQSVAYPWEGLNKKLFGLRQGELVTIAGGTGLGKSAVTRELEHWLLHNTEDNIGVIALEEKWERTVDGVLAIEAEAKLHLDHIREEFSEDQLKKFEQVLYDKEGSGRFWVHDHWGASDVDDILSKLRFLVVGCDCKWIILDHIHMIVSSMMEGNERQAIDSLMTKLRGLVEETGVGLIAVSHLRKIEGNRGHETGAEVNLHHMRGSQGIAQLSDCVIALERNQQSEDPVEANTTRLRILKSRYTGDVGIAGYLLYDHHTGRMKEMESPDFEASDAGEVSFE